MRVAATLLAAVAFMLGSAATVSAGSPPRPGDIRDCGTRGEGRSPQKLPRPAGPRLGPLTFWPMRTPAGRTGRATWPFAAKTPVVLPARSKVVLAIAPRATAQAAFQSGRGGYVSAVRFEACPAGEPAFAYHGTVGRFTGFPFAIGLRRRSACIPMELWIDGRATPIRRVVPIGRRSC